MKYLILLSLLSSSCTFRMGGARNEVQKGHYRLYSHPEAEDEYTDDLVKRILIVSTNDMFGNLLPQAEPTYSATKKEALPYYVGGVSYFSSYLKILKSKYADQILVVDAGNSLKGTLLTSSFDGEPTLKIFDYLGYDAIVLGPNDLTFQENGKKQRRYPLIENLQEKFTNKNFTLLSSNLIYIAKGSPLEGEGIAASLIKEINGVKVGLIGVTTPHVLTKHQKEIFTGLYLDNFKKSIFENSQLLKAKGAQVIILIANTSISCGESIAAAKSLPIEKTNFKPLTSDSCKLSNELMTAIKEVTPGSIDVIITGGTESKVSNFIQGIPVIQNFGKGKYFSRLEIFYDSQKKKLVKKKTIIHQPTMLCHNFFDETEDCYSRDLSVNHDKIISATFLGVPIQKDEVVDKLLEPYTLKVNKLAQKNIVNLTKGLPHNKDPNSPFATFVVDSLRKKIQSNIGIIFDDSIKYGLMEGELTYGKLFSALPITSNLLEVKIKGKVLKDIIRESLLKDKYSKIYVSGLNIVVVTKKEDEVENTSTEEPWKKRKEVLVFLEDGSSLVDGKEYSVATVNFPGIHLNSNFTEALNNIHYKKKKVHKVNYRDIIQEEIQNTKSFESVINKYNTTNRVIFQDY